MGKKLTILLSVCCLFGLQSFTLASSSNAIDRVNEMIGKGECSKADTHARANLERPVVYTVLGFVSLDCRHDRKTAVEFFRLAARDNEDLAISMLIKMGEVPPEPIAENRERGRQYQQPPPIQPYQTITPQQQVIVQQPQQVHQVQNLGACTQDGGTLHCPNHPNTAIRPFNLNAPFRYR